MRANKISSETFNGKIHFDKKLPKHMKEYANAILDYPVNGTTARNRIKKASYDVGFSNLSSKKAIHPLLRVITSVDILNKDTRYLGHNIRTHYSSITGATEINRFLDWVDNFKENNNHSYNNFSEKMIAIWKKLNGIRN